MFVGVVSGGTKEMKVHRAIGMRGSGQAIFNSTVNRDPVLAYRATFHCQFVSNIGTVVTRRASEDKPKSMAQVDGAFRGSVYNSF